MRLWGAGTAWHEATTRSNPNGALIPNFPVLIAVIWYKDNLAGTGHEEPHEGHSEVAALLRKHVEVTVANAMRTRQDF